jgi:hypothetical protein
MVRGALTVASPALALRMSDGVEPYNPLARHALITVRAAHAAARGDHQAAADDYAKAAERWHTFEVLPNRRGPNQGCACRLCVVDAAPRATGSRTGRVLSAGSVGLVRQLLISL